VEGVTIILLREDNAGNAGLGSAHLRGKDLSRVFLADPHQQLISSRVARFDEAVSEGRRVSIEVSQVPVEFLLVKAHSIKHVVARDGNFVLTGHCISWELRIDPGPDRTGGRGRLAESAFE
jgi:hypothetical protein